MAELASAPPAAAPRVPEPSRPPAVSARPSPSPELAELLGTAPGPAPSTEPAARSVAVPQPAPTRSPRVEPVPAPTFASIPWDDTPAGGTAAAPTLAIAETEVIEVRARPAALWQRISAFIIDGTLVCGVLGIYVGVAAALISPRGVPSTQLTGIDGLMARVHQLHSVLAPCVALALVLGLVYTAAFALLWNGRTPGRRLMGIRLVDRTGLAPAPGRAIVRAVLALVSFVPFLAGFWLALFDRRGQTLHDKLTQTFVVRPG
jgi:uncharacterized RDD family membrane protein YckC